MSQHRDMPIPDDMRAAVYYGPGDIRMERVRVPSPANGEVLVRVLRSGLCGTDLTEWTNGPKMIPLHSEHPYSRHRGPMITGHEFVGEVVLGTQGLERGQLVVCGAGVPCWECERCLEGRTNICQRLYSLGLHVHGGNAEYVLGPPRSFCPIPAGLDLDSAGITQPLAVGIHAARRSGAHSGDQVLIIGAGAIGTFVLAGLRHLFGGLDISVADIDRGRLERSARLGADHTINLQDGESLPSGPDLVVEATGAPGQLGRAVRLVRPGGRVLAVGMPAQPGEIDVHHLVFNEITLDSSVALVIEDDLQSAIEVLATTPLASELVDSVRPLSAITATLDMLANGEIAGKVLLDPTIS